jgi:succinate dehydrogenase/fumarate reductase flavoprotein subunit
MENHFRGESIMTTRKLPELIRSETIAQWGLDGAIESADVIVVGCGAAGASAAVEARQAGADVLVIERASSGGGASSIAGGHLYLGGGTPVQTACGFEDSPEDMYNYLMALTPDPDPEKLRLYCEQSVAHFHWLEVLGVPFERSYYPGKAAMQPGTECLIWSGNEKAWPFRELAKPAPRGHKVAAADMGGHLLMQRLIEAANELGVRMQYDTAVTQLVVDENQRVVGVAVRRFGDERFIRARNGVILSAGGYIMNDDLFDKELAWMPRDLIKHGTTYDDGSGIFLGASAGGVPTGMDCAFLTSPFYPPEDLIKGILVNANGQRFVAEDSYHGRTVGFSIEQPQGIAYLILDADIFGYPPYEFFEQKLVDGWETVAEMEAALDFPNGSLAKTIESYNRHALQGTDPEFHKHPDWLKPLDSGPYAAFDLSVGRAKFAGFSLGGLRTNADSQVLDSSAEPIAGLYAAGACAWNIAQDSRGYSSGTCLGEATFFGRRAGLHAARATMIAGLSE